MGKKRSLPDSTPNPWVVHGAQVDHLLHGPLPQPLREAVNNPKMFLADIDLEGCEELIGQLTRVESDAENRSRHLEDLFSSLREHFEPVQPGHGRLLPVPLVVAQAQYELTENGQIGDWTIRMLSKMSTQISDHVPPGRVNSVQQLHALMLRQRHYLLSQIEADVPPPPVVGSAMDQPTTAPPPFSMNGSAGNGLPSADAALAGIESDSEDEIIYSGRPATAMIQSPQPGGQL